MKKKSLSQIRVFNDGSLYLTNVQLEYAGNYTCHALRNQDVVQTHMLTIYSKCFKKIYRGIRYRGWDKIDFLNYFRS